MAEYMQWTAIVLLLIARIGDGFRVTRLEMRADMAENACRRLAESDASLAGSTVDCLRETKAALAEIRQIVERA
jgi:hypothetical protein